MWRKGGIWSIIIGAATITGSAVVLLLLAASGNAFYDLEVKQYVEEQPWLVWIGVCVIAVLVSSLDYLRNRKKGQTGKGGFTVIEKSLFEEARTDQIEKFKQRRRDKLAGRDFINIEVSYTVKGSATIATQINRGVTEGEREQDIFTVFEESEGRILIIGEPGSGKTTLLLDLAGKIFEAYPEQIPVILDVATWQSRFKNIEEWAIELLPDIGFNSNLAKEVVAEKKVLPLFDGLDELEEKSREGFLKAVEQYSTDSDNRFVVTSRVVEYEGTIDAAIERQVIMEPFELSQIRTALREKYSPERTAIIDRIEKDEYFREAIKTPFYLNAVQHLYSKKSNSAKLTFKSDDLEGRKQEITDAFVGDAIMNIHGYESKNISKWLAFLADRITTRKLVSFELVDMQYDWGRWSQREHLIAYQYRNLVVGLPIFPFVVLFVCIAGMIFIDSSFGEYQIFFLNLFPLILISICVGLLTILSFGFTEIFKGIDNKITVKDKNTGRFRDLIISFREDWLFFLRAGVYQGLPAGLLAGIFFGLAVGPVEGVLLGITFGLLITATGVLVKLFTNGFTSYLKIDNPYQRFQGSTRSLHFSIIQHWYLCHLLRKRDLVTRHYPQFLDASATAYILETDGGNWRFRHRILQEYFVGVWEEEYGEDEALRDGLNPKEIVPKVAQEDSKD